MGDSVKPEKAGEDANLKGSHPSPEKAKEAGHFHIDGAEFLHVILDGPDGKVSQRDSDLTAKDRENHVPYGEAILDEEALETGYGLLHLVVPIVAPGINRSSAAALVAFAHVIDNDMHKDMDYDHLNDLKVAGKTFHEHAVDLVTGLEDGEYKDFVSGAIEHSIHRQFQYTKKRKDISNWKAPKGMDDFLKWRNYEGGFYTCLLVFLTAGGDTLWSHTHLAQVDDAGIQYASHRLDIRSRIAVMLNSSMKFTEIYLISFCIPNFISTESVCS